MISNNYQGHCCCQNNLLNQRHALQSANSGSGALNNPQADNVNAPGSFGSASLLNALLQLVTQLMEQLQGGTNSRTESQSLSASSQEPQDDMETLRQAGFQTLDEVLGDEQNSNVSTITNQGNGANGTTPSLIIDMNKDGKFSGGDFIVDTAIGHARRVDTVQSGVSDLGGLEAQMAAQRDAVAGLSDSERDALAEQSNNSQYDLVSTLPKDLIGQVEDVSGVFAIDINRDGHFSGGDVLVDPRAGRAQNVSSVDQEVRIINDLSNLEAQMATQRNAVSNLSPQELDKAEANTFNILSPSDI